MDRRTNIGIAGGITVTVAAAVAAIGVNLGILSSSTAAEGPGTFQPTAAVVTPSPVATSAADVFEASPAADSLPTPASTYPASTSPTASASPSASGGDPAEYGGDHAEDGDHHTDDTGHEAHEQLGGHDDDD